MTAEEKILTIIEDISKYNNTPKIEIGTLNSSMGIETNNITIPRSMIYFFDFLLEKRAKKVNGTVEIGGGGEAPHTHGWTDTSEYIEPLKSGDLIAYYTLSNSTILVLGRVIK